MYKAKASLVMRDGKGNHYSSPTFLFIVGVIQGYHTYQRIGTPHVGEKTMVRESGNEHNRFAVLVLKNETLCTVGSESLVFLGRPGPLFARFIGGSELGFHDIGSGASFGSLLEVVCNTHFCLSSLSILHLALLLDSFYRRFLIMCHISNVVS